MASDWLPSFGTARVGPWHDLGTHGRLIRASARALGDTVKQGL